MEMPFDILNHRLGKIRDNGDADFDNTAAAVGIDEELQQKFLFFPIEELEELLEQVEESRGLLHLGQGHGHLSLPEHITLEDAYTVAENALGLYWRVKRGVELQAEEDAKLARRPEPGLYITSTGSASFTQVVTADRRVLTVTNTGDLNDSTGTYDSLVAEGRLEKIWQMRRVDIAEGSVSA